MPYTDHSAADRIRELREDRGLSVEGLARAIKRLASDEGWYKVHGAVDAFTLRRIEDAGHLPSIRVRLVISLFFGVSHRELWKPANRRQIEARSHERRAA